MPAPSIRSAVELPENQDQTSRQSSVMGPILNSVGWPIVVGLVAFWGFLLALDKGWVTSELLVRYLSAHPVSYVATGMFFVGIASLGMKLVNVLIQIADRPNVTLPAPPALAQRAEESRHLLEDLDQLSNARQDSYLGRRLRSALEYVDKTESANGLEDELKYLADIDADKQQESFGLTRILIWAIPMLGFLGTVIGISAALGGLSVESDFNVMLTGLKEKLYVAFDTTALALTLSIVLMFCQFIVNRLEVQLLASVDERASEELSGRFVTFGTARDPYLASVENMSGRVLDTIAEAGNQQADVWNQGLAALQETADTTLGRFAEVLADRLSKQLDPILDELAISLRSAINESSSFLDRFGNRLQETIDGSVEAVEQKNQVIADTIEGNATVWKEITNIHSNEIKQCVANSDELMQQHLKEVREVMKKTVDLVTSQTQQVSMGIENSQEIIRFNSNSIQQALESANQFMEQHTTQLGQVVQASSQVLEVHSEKISDAVTRSEQIVDKRQETIFQTQESMLKAQVQQSMAIASFTEKLESLEQIVQQSGSLEGMQKNLNETLSALERSDTIANEIHGLARLVREQVKSVDRAQYAQAQSSEQQLSSVIEHTNKIADQNAELLSHYQEKIDSLVESVGLSQQVHSQSSEKQLIGIIEHTQKIFDQNAGLLTHYQNKIDDLAEALAQPNDEKLAESLTEKVAESFQTLTMQLVNQNQSLAQLQEQLRSSFDFESVANRMVDVFEQLNSESNRSNKNSMKLDKTVRELAQSVREIKQTGSGKSQELSKSPVEFGHPDTPKRVA